MTISEDRTRMTISECRKDRDKAKDWLKRQGKDIEFSDLGGNVALFLERMWGLHHIKMTSLSKVDWSNGTWIDIVIDKQMATVDNSDLTRLVVIAHQMMLRVDLGGVGPGYIRLTFHQRTTRNRDNGSYKWCPDIHDHVDMIAKCHTPIDQEIE